jgi:Tfp pilus assembly protein PilO
MGRTDRLWLIGGLVVVALLVTGGWFLVISPKYAQTDEVHAEADAASIQLIKLNKEIAELLTEEKTQSTYVAELETKKTALPTGYNIPAYVRSLQDSGTAAGIDLSGITVGAPVKASVNKAVEIPIGLVAKGTPATLSVFLTRLQNRQPRAVLVKTVGMSTGDEGSSDAGSTTANLTLSAFCLEPAKVTTADNCTIS